MIWKIRGMSNQKQTVSRPGSEASYSSRVTENIADIQNGDQEIILNQDDLKKVSSTADVNRVSFLTVPTSPDIRRPSTADVVIEKLQVEKMEGGGMSISGVAIVANCHLSLIIFGVFFLLAGLVLSYIGFGTGGKGEFPEGGVAQAAGAPKGTFQKPDSHFQMQIIGPIFLIVGLLMLLVGISMFAIHRKVSKDDKKKRLARSAVQIHQLENNFSQAQAQNCSPIHTVISSPNYAHPILSLRRGSWWMEPTPIEEPQTPSSLNPTEHNQSSRRNSRSPSPSQERNILILDYPSYPQDMIQAQNEPYSSQMYSSIGQPPATPYNSESFKKSSTASSFISYSTNAAGDIATFPGEDMNSIASFPVIIHPPKEEESLYSNERMPSADPSVYSLYEDELRNTGRGGNGSASSFASAEYDRQFQRFSANSTASRYERTDSVDTDVASFPSAPEIIRHQFTVPKIQVGSSFQQRVIPSFENAKKMMIAEGSTTRNLPLSKNGIALPRLSRHSVSSRPSELVSGTKSDSSHPSRQESFGSNQEPPYSSQEQNPPS